MKKLVCKFCGNTEFSSNNSDKIICKCGSKIPDPGNQLMDEFDKVEEELFFLDQQINAEVILKISLIKREIDKCLDERDEEKFHKLSTDLNHYLDILDSGMEGFEESILEG